MRHIPKIFLLIAVALTVSCNKNSTSWMNRKYQNMVARYNIYYNGTLKLNEAVANLALNQKDNYAEVLDVFPYGDDAQAKAQAAVMEEIIKKASKIITDRPVSKWVDDAYLLMGKAYFFKGEYYAAIETFQYINTRYKGTPIAKEATVWILKSYLRLKRYNDAEAIVSLLKNEKDFPEYLTGLFNAAAADVYIKQKKYSSALQKIQIALSVKQPRSRRSRYSFIEAQLFERLGKGDSAKMLMEKVIRLNPPYEMAFNAKISLARNYNPNSSSEVRAARRHLRGMLRDDKNSSYFDQIYYQLGNIEAQQNNLNDAVKYYRLSLSNSQNNQNQKGLSYLALADLYYNMPSYKESQAYYDSAVKVINTDFPNYQSIIKKQSVLSELIKYKIMVEREDSLQYLASLSPAELDKLTDKWLRDEKELKKRQEKEKERQQNNPGFVPQPGGGLPQAPGGNNFYFYSAQQLSLGYTDFLRRWGNRKLTDDWRWSQKEKGLITDNGGGTGDTKDKKAGGDTATKNNEPVNEKLKDIPEEKRKYYTDIPYSPEDKKLSNEKLKTGLYNIGIIYFEQLKDYDASIASFTDLLKRFPGSDYEPSVYFYLFKIYTQTGKVDKAAEYKQLLISKYPDSDYALILNNNLGVRESDGTGMDKRKVDFYNTTFDLFNNNKYAEVKQRRATADTLLVGTVLMPKYSLLYAMSVGKTESVERYKKTLDTIMEQYPATEIARKAKELQDAIKRFEAKNAPKDSTQKSDTAAAVVFDYMPEAGHFVIITVPARKADINTIRVNVSNFNASNFPSSSFEVTSSVLNENTQLVIIKAFENKTKSLDYLQQLENYHSFLMGVDKSEVGYYVITPANYIKVLRSKDVTLYSNFYKKNYNK